MYQDSIEQWKLSNFLINEVYSRASGNKNDLCERNYPRDVYFVGNLRPVPQNKTQNLQEEAPHLNELVNKLAPVAFGSEFKFIQDAEKSQVNIVLNWNCYYRVLPTYKEQNKYQSLDRSESSYKAPLIAEEPEVYYVEPPISAENTEYINNEDEEIESLNELRQHTRTQRDSLYIKFKKIQCRANGVITIQKSLNTTWIVDASDLEARIHEEVRRAQQVVLNDPARIKTARSPEQRVRIPQEALDSEVTYRKFIDSLQTDVIPQWSWEIRANVRSEQSSDNIDTIFHLEFVNTSPMDVNQSPNTEPYLFDVKAEISFTGCTILPFEIELVPSGFRYNRQLWARGLNCAVEKLSSNSSFRTTNIPIYTQMRYRTRSIPEARFEELAREPVPVLENILQAMHDYYTNDWPRKRLEYSCDDPEWDQLFGTEFDRDRDKFYDEIKLFTRGLEIIKNNPDVMLAFKLTNETFRRGDPNKTSWRLFQIVFLVTQIPAIAAVDNLSSSDYAQREYVDIIYFPTGGGKTEAYLGVLVFHCFFDRLRGKTAGVTAWTRFPLRLLTLQQTQRIADAIGIAELVRQEQVDPRLSGIEVDGFGVGYFVGREGTPNEIVTPTPGESPEANWSKANDHRARQEWKKIFRCPSCRTNSVIVDFDPHVVRILHKCQEANCAYPNGIIPVYVVDNEIYRYLPSVIVGTIDKLAGLGNQRKFSLVFGQVDGKCEIHGYYKANCCQKECRNRNNLNRKIPRGISGPTLFIQDELHLLKEGLGTFDAHYETFTQKLMSEFGQKSTLKIIASSATIEAFERQVEHLYGRERRYARVFPGLGPSQEESFYAETLSYPQRLYVGLIPHNKTIFNTILELIQYYHEVIQELQDLPLGSKNPYGGQISPGTSDWLKLLDLYTTSLTYFLSNRELNSIRADLEGDVNPNLENNGYRPLQVLELTGSTSSDEVTNILNVLEKPSQQGTPPHTVLATSMISHGVDVNRFNAMFFYGMPRQNAEYIQASSRVGRTHVGIAFVCMHPARERDQSHYSYFIKFHEFLGQLVEPVAINRWSTFSINRTLPGLFMATLLQLLSHKQNRENPNKFYRADFVKQLIARGDITSNDFIPILEDAYKVTGHLIISSETFRTEIRRLVNLFLDFILQAGPQASWVSEALIPQPLTSLRDVDELVEIELDNDGTTWAIRSGRG